MRRFAQPQCLSDLPSFRRLTQLREALFAVPLSEVILILEKICAITLKGKAELLLDLRSFCLVQFSWNLQTRIFDLQLDQQLISEVEYKIWK